MLRDQRALSVTPRALSVTQRARSVIQRALSVTQRKAIDRQVRDQPGQCNKDSTRRTEPGGVQQAGKLMRPLFLSPTEPKSAPAGGAVMCSTITRRDAHQRAAQALDDASDEQPAKRRSIKEDPWAVLEARYGVPFPEGEGFWRLVTSPRGVSPALVEPTAQPLPRSPSAGRWGQRPSSPRRRRWRCSPAAA
jgi:hypothetical protein